MNSPPNTIQINGVAWTFRRMTKTELYEDSDESLLGQAKHTQAEIQVRSDLPPDRMRHIVWHELFHAVEKDAGFDFTEEQVRAMSNGLFAILRNNPTLAAWLLEMS